MTALRLSVAFIAALLVMLPTRTAFALAPQAIEATAEDRAAFAGIMADAAARNYGVLPFGELVQTLAASASLQSRLYSSAPLDHDLQQEHVYAGFARFDCVTFVETVLALADTITRQEQSFGDYAAHLATQRYRAGEPAYCERLHYFSDWLRLKVSAGTLMDVTAEIAGGEHKLAFAVEPQGLNYLSRHAASNPALAGNAARQACVLRSEAAISASLARSQDDGAPGFAYIPKSLLAEVSGRLQGGDIVAWVANQSGLDVIHVGIVLRPSGASAPGFAHASLRNGRVAIAPDLLSYERTLPRQRGLIVLRPRAPSLRD